MGFSRVETPSVAPDHEALTAAMAGIGMNFAAAPAAAANIEDTLLFASMAGMEGGDLRVLAALVTWFGVHRAWVNADRLTKLVDGRGSLRVRAFWSALARWQAKDRRFARLEAMCGGPPVELLTTGTGFQIRRHGEDPRFAGSCLRVPASVLRDRAADVLCPEALARRHRAYRYRVMIGPSYRADLWAALEADPDLSPAELARRTYASFASAWQVRRDFLVLRGSGEQTEGRRSTSRELAGVADALGVRDLEPPTGSRRR
jgi:hypothetical protein